MDEILWIQIKKTKSIIKIMSYCSNSQFSVMNHFITEAISLIYFFNAVIFNMDAFLSKISIKASI